MGARGIIRCASSVGGVGVSFKYEWINEWIPIWETRPPSDVSQPFRLVTSTPRLQTVTRPEAKSEAQVA